MMVSAASERRQPFARTWNRGRQWWEPSVAMVAGKEPQRGVGEGDDCHLA